eukprot:COSAG01_NODE_28455_length_660_cov_3.099822_1_plen_86_part_10
MPARARALKDSIIVQSENELTLHVVSTKIKFRCTIPLHERCPELSQFFTDVWIPIKAERTVGPGAGSWRMSCQQGAAPTRQAAQLA